MVNVEMTLKVLVEAGFVINHKKSNLVPSQRFQYLGLIWDTSLAQISLPPVRFQDLHSMALQVQSSLRLSCSSLLRLLRLMSATIPAIPLVQLKSRFLQRSQSSVSDTECDPLLPVTLSEEARADLDWVVRLRPQDCVTLLWPPSIRQAFLRDASDDGWGLYFEGRMERGLWSATDVLLHINVKELIVLRIFLEDFFPFISRPVKVVRWELDNTTALA